MSERPLAAGDRVRSFDFSDRGPDGFAVEGDHACFVEGVVEGILPAGEVHPCGARFPDCDRVVLRCTRRMFSGRSCPDDVGRRFFPPVNGIPKLFGGEANGIRHIEEN